MHAEKCDHCPMRELLNGEQEGEGMSEERNILIKAAETIMVNQITIMGALVSLVTDDDSLAVICLSLEKTKELVGEIGRIKEQPDV